VDLGPAEGEVFAEYACGAEAIRVRGAVIGAVTPVNKMAPAFKIQFKAPKGVQQVDKFEGGPVQVLEVSVDEQEFHPAGLSVTEDLTASEPVEIRTED